MPKDKTKKPKEDSKNEYMARPVKAQISSTKVKSTWLSISDTGQQDMAALLRDVSLPVIHAIRGEKKRSEFQQLLQRIETKTNRRLTKIPVPPTTRNAHYRYDKLVDQRDQLQHALSWLLEHTTHLEAEIENEEQQLEDDKVYLENLKKNVRNQGQISNTSNVKTAKDLLAKYECEDDDDDELEDKTEDINYKENKLAKVQNDSLDKHSGKIFENTTGLAKLLDSAELLNSQLK